MLYDMYKIYTHIYIIQQQGITLLSNTCVRHTASRLAAAFSEGQSEPKVNRARHIIGACFCV
jgi:hypothetical protein